MGYKTSAVWSLLRIQSGIDCGLNPSGSCEGRNVRGLGMHWEGRDDDICSWPMWHVKKGIFLNDLQVSFWVRNQKGKLGRCAGLGRQVGRWRYKSLELHECFMKIYIFGIHEQMGNVQTQSPRADQLWRDYSWRWREPGIKPGEYKTWRSTKNLRARERRGSGKASEGGKIDEWDIPKGREKMCQMV